MPTDRKSILTMNGEPIKNEQDFCAYYHREELLEQQQAFWRFAGNNWMYMRDRSFNVACYEIYHRKAKPSSAICPTQWEDFFLLFPSAKKELNEKAQKDLDLWFLDWQNAGSISEQFCTQCAMLILAHWHMQQVHVPETGYVPPKKAEQGYQSLVSAELKLEPLTVGRVLTNHFYFRYNPRYCLKDGDRLHTVRLYSADEKVTLFFKAYGGRYFPVQEIDLLANEELWVNAVGDVVVSILSKRSVSSLPEKASSTVELPDGTVVYLQDGRLGHTRVTSVIHKRWYEYRGAYVELGVMDGRLYVLSDRGEILSRGVSVSERVISLQNYLNERKAAIEE